MLLSNLSSTLVGSRKSGTKKSRRGIRSIKHLFTENQKYLFDVGVQNYDDMLEIYPLDARI